MSERLSELSASVSMELNKRLLDSGGRINTAQSILKGMRNEPPAQVDGIHLILDDIVILLEKVDELHLAALKQVGDTYGHIIESEARENSDGKDK